MKVWCVRHRDGWCAASRQSRKPAEGTNSVPTKCKHFVILPGGIDRRVPTCEECLEVLRERS